MDYTIENLVYLIQKWAKARNIIQDIPRGEYGEVAGDGWPEGGGTLVGQARKLVEEATEVLEAATMLDMLAGIQMADPETHCEALREAEQLLIDGIGDTAVVLSVICGGEGLSLLDCFKEAYMEIKDRKGRMINGKFVKAADLPEGE